MGRTRALEDLSVELLARGLSVRDIEDAFKDESGRLLLSRTAVSEMSDVRQGKECCTCYSPCRAIIGSSLAAW